MSIEQKKNIKKEILEKHGEIIASWLFDLSAYLKNCESTTEYLKSELIDFIRMPEASSNIEAVLKIIPTLESCATSVKTYTEMIVRGLERLMEVIYSDSRDSCQKIQSETAAA
jgi:ferritin-like protein